MMEEAFTASIVLQNHHSFSTFSSFSSSSDSDLDSQSTVSFFPDQSTTLGSLMGLRQGHIPSGPLLHRSLSAIVHSNAIGHHHHRPLFDPLCIASTRERNTRNIRSASTGLCCFTNCVNFKTTKAPNQASHSHSLGHLLKEERQASIRGEGDISTIGGAEEKVYINIMYEEDGKKEMEVDGVTTIPIPNPNPKTTISGNGFLLPDHKTCLDTSFNSQSNAANCADETRFDGIIHGLDSPSDQSTQQGNSVICYTISDSPIAFSDHDLDGKSGACHLCMPICMPGNWARMGSGICKPIFGKSKGGRKHNVPKDQMSNPDSISSTIAIATILAALN